jgi:predicted nucleic acid-binding protein
MIVVADTTPLNHLILIDKVSLLKTLYGRVIIPYAVLSELQDEATPPRVKEWIGNRPDWLEVKHPLPFQIRAWHISMQVSATRSFWPCSLKPTCS